MFRPARASVCDLVDAGRVVEHDIGGAPAARLMRQRNEGGGVFGLVQFEHGEPNQQPGAVGIVAAVEQRKDRLMQQSRDPHHEFHREVFAAVLPRQPGEIEIQRAHLDIRQHVDGMLKTCRPQTARSGGTSQRPFGVVTCMVPLAA